MKNIVGDVLQRPALAGAEIAPDGHRPQAARRQRGRRARRSPRRSACRRRSRPTPTSARRSTAPTSSSSPSRSAATSRRPSPTSRCRRQFGLRQTIADTLGIGGIMRGIRTVPHLWKICADMTAGLPRRDHAAVRQPDGDQHLGDRREIPAHPPGRPLPLGAGHRRGAGARPRHPDREDPLPLGRHQPHGLLPQLRGDHAGRLVPRPLPRPPSAATARAASRSATTTTRAARTRCATRC